jgi:rsbT co-antagonist protein RsbR
MVSSIQIIDLEVRLRALEQALVGTATEQFHHIESEHDDLLTSVEAGVNLVVGNLRAEIDKRVHERTQELQAKLAELTAQHELVRRQQEAIRQMSTPILRLWDQVLALPLIGVIDTRRSATLMDELLDAIAAGNVRFAILDVTGVEVLDTSIAAHLMKIIQSAQLLGAQCVLTGVQPNVAQTLVGIGVDFDALLIRRNLQEGLKACLVAMNRSKDGVPGVVR